MSEDLILTEEEIKQAIKSQDGFENHVPCNTYDDFERDRQDILRELGAKG